MDKSIYSLMKSKKVNISTIVNSVLRVAYSQSMIYTARVRFPVLALYLALMFLRGICITSSQLA